MNDDAGARPGRKSGRRHVPHAQRAMPPRIDETDDVPLPPLPPQCPCCGDRLLRETHVAPQCQTEIPRTIIDRRFDVHIGICAHCGHTVQGRHALQTSTARGAAASQLGANIHAALAIMNKQLGLSHGKPRREWRDGLLRTLSARPAALCPIAARRSKTSRQNSLHAASATATSSKSCRRLPVMRGSVSHSRRKNLIKRGKATNSGRAKAVCQRHAGEAA